MSYITIASSYRLAKNISIESFLRIALDARGFMKYARSSGDGCHACAIRSLGDTWTNLFEFEFPVTCISALPYVSRPAHTVRPGCSPNALLYHLYLLIRQPMSMHGCTKITFGDILKTTRLSKQNDIRRCKFAKKPKSACPVKKAQSSTFNNWSCRTCIPVSNHSTAHAPARRVEPCTASLVKDRGKSRALKPC